MGAGVDDDDDEEVAGEHTKMWDSLPKKDISTRFLGKQPCHILTANHTPKSVITY
jgi:hypothetical protein